MNKICKEVQNFHNTFRVIENLWIVRQQESYFLFVSLKFSSFLISLTFFFWLQTPDPLDLKEQLRKNIDEHKGAKADVSKGTQCFIPLTFSQSFSSGSRKDNDVVKVRVKDDFV